MAKLILFPGSPQQAEIDLDGRERLALGRDDASDVVLRRRMASRRHALIEQRQGRYFLRDTDSYNGTLVNEQPVRDTQLLHGDEIRIAGCLLRFEDPLHADEASQRDTLRLPTAPIDHDEILEVSPSDLHALATSDAAGLPEPGITADDRELLAGREAAGGAFASRATDAALATSVTPAAPAPARPAPARISLNVAPPAEPSGGARGLRLLLLGLGFGLLATLAWILLQPGSGSGPAPRGAAAGGSAPDDLAYASALAVSGEERLDRLWEFLRSHPGSGHREAAYLALLEQGASPPVVCEHARRNASDLIGPGMALAGRCGEP